VRNAASGLVAVLALSACSEPELASDLAIDCAHYEVWNKPLRPFRIYGSTYYVGTAGLSSILIESGEGLVLIDGALPQSAGQIVANIDTLGFDARDIRIIAVSHAHYDHAGGVAALQRLTGASVVAGEAAVRMLQAGRSFEDDPQFGLGSPSFPPVADVLVADAETELVTGEIAVRAVPTPGHSPGGTSWTWRSCEGERCLDIVYADSLSAVSAQGYRFSDGAAGVIRESAANVAALDCDILLSTHDFSFGLHEKLAAGGGEAFEDPEACWAYAETALDGLERRLEAEASSP
jgi:metallo-beta-lactamase class B